MCLGLIRTLFFSALQIFNTLLQVDTFYHMRLYSIQASISLKHNMNSSHSYYTRTAEFLHLLMAIIFIAARAIGFLWQLYKR